MTLAQAQAAAAALRVALLDNGVRAVSLELQQGVSTSGWGVAPFKRGMGHHIVSRPSQGPNPGLALVKRGRPDLGGPLCNGYGGYDLVARIITLGWANHPGAGGPWAVPGWGAVPKDNGRPYIFGWEFEGGLEPYTDEMHDFMARCGAGTLDWLGTLPGNPGPAPLECFGEHKDPWAGARKIDRLGYTAATGRARIAAVRGASPAPTPQEEDDAMPQMIRNDDTGEMVLAGPGLWYAIPEPVVEYVKMYAARGFVRSTTADVNCRNNEFLHFRTVYLSANPLTPVLDYQPHHGNAEDNLLGHILSIRQEVEGGASSGTPVSVDIKALAAELRELLPEVDSQMTDARVEAALRKVLREGTNAA